MDNENPRENNHNPQRKIASCGPQESNHTTRLLPQARRRKRSFQVPRGIVWIIYPIIEKCRLQEMLGTRVIDSVEIVLKCCGCKGDGATQEKLESDATPWRRIQV